MERLELEFGSSEVWGCGGVGGEVCGTSCGIWVDCLIFWGLGKEGRAGGRPADAGVRLALAPPKHEECWGVQSGWTSKRDVGENKRQLLAD